MKIVTMVGLLLMLVIISGCCLPSYEPIPEEKEQFIGRWVSEDNQLLVINAAGSGNYDGYMKDVSGSSMEINYGAITITDNEIKIEIMFFLRTFEITRQPYEEAGNTYMELDGVKFRKQ